MDFAKTSGVHLSRKRWKIVRIIASVELWIRSWHIFCLFHPMPTQAKCSLSWASAPPSLGHIFYISKALLHSLNMEDWTYPLVILSWFYILLNKVKTLEVHMVQIFMVVNAWASWRWYLASCTSLYFKLVDVYLA